MVGNLILLKRVLASAVVCAALFALLAFQETASSASDAASGAAPVDTGEIVNTISFFNKVYTDILVTDGVPAMLNKMPSSTQIRHELFRHIGYLREHGLILVMDMADMKLISINSPAGHIVEAVTFEEWNYLYHELGTRKLARSIKGMGQGYRYTLRNSPEGWRIVDFQPEDVEVDPDESFKY